MPPYKAHYKGTLTPDQNFTKIGLNGEDLQFKEGDDSSPYRVKPTALDIIWGNDSRYWRFKDDKAELLQVCWLEVSGGIPLKYLKAKTYKIHFRISKKPDAFGWDNSPIYLMAKVGEDKPIWKKFDVTTLRDGSPSLIPDDLTITVKSDMVNQPEQKLSFGLYEIWKGRWKGGLVIHNVDVLPQEARPT